MHCGCVCYFLFTVQPQVVDSVVWCIVMMKSGKRMTLVTIGLASHILLLSRSNYPASILGIATSHVHHKYFLSLHVMFTKGYPFTQALRKHHTSTGRFVSPSDLVRCLCPSYCPHVPLPGQKHHDTRLVCDAGVRWRGLVQRMLRKYVGFGSLFWDVCAAALQVVGMKVPFQAKPAANIASSGATINGT